MPTECVCDILTLSLAAGLVCYSVPDLLCLAPSDLGLSHVRQAAVVLGFDPHTSMFDNTTT